MKKWMLLWCCVTLPVLSAQWTNTVAPDFQLNDQAGKSRQLSEFKDRWLVVYFYPKDKTSGCTTEAQNFARDYDKFRRANAEVVGVSLDDVASHRDFASIHKLPFPLLADVDKKMSKAYGVLGLGGLYSKRETFVINPDGTIVKHYNDVDPENHSTELLRDLVALKLEPR